MKGFTRSEENFNHRFTQIFLNPRAFVLIRVLIFRGGGKPCPS